MGGLVAEALKHTIEEAPEKGPVLDAAIIAQYQRMTHYGCRDRWAFAKALKLDDDTKKLSVAVKEMHGSDDLVSHLAETAVNAAAASA